MSGVTRALRSTRWKELARRITDARANYLNVASLWRLVTSYYFKLCYFTSTALGSAIIAFAGIISAALISVNSTQILSDYNNFTFPRQFADAHEILKITDTQNLWPAVKFALIAILTIFLRETGLVNAARQKEHDLQNRLTTMPPKQFLALYSDTAIRVRALFDSLRTVNSKQLNAPSIAADIRTVLTQILVLAQTWDSAPRETYRANIMLAVEAQDPAAHDLEPLVAASPFFLFDSNFAACLERADGLLYLSDNQLTTCTQARGQPDASIEPVCFPYSFGTKAVPPKHPNLPGAPVAISSLQPHYIESTPSVIREWLHTQAQKNSHIHPHYINRITSYYDQQLHAQSILSIPLTQKTDHAAGIKRLACLNIYKNESHILMGESRNTQFVQLLEPLCDYLQGMILLYVAIRKVEASRP